MNFDILKNITQISYLTVLYYHMPPQISRLRWRITTQVTFEWLFSAVSVCPRRCKITLLDCIRMTLSNSYTSSVCFQMCPQMACIGGRHCCLCICLVFLHCVFLNVSSLWEDFYLLGPWLDPNWQDNQCDGTIPWAFQHDDDDDGNQEDIPIDGGFT